MKRVLIISLFFLAAVSTTSAQGDWKQNDKRANLLFGMNQLFLGGFNVEGNFVYKRFIFDYSHGVNLNFDNSILTGDAQSQQLDMRIPWTTGFGIGYRFTEVVNARIEPKWHRFEGYYAGEAKNSENLLFDYTTFTLGVGLYANFRPFKNKDNGLNGLMVVPSIRYWPRISSSLENDELTYFNERTNQTEVHEAQQVGIANSPLIINVSIGYSFNLKKK